MPSLNLFFLASWLTTLLYYLSFFSPSFLVLLLNITIFKKSISISCITSLSCIMCLAAVFIAKSEKSIVIRSLLPVFYLTSLLLKKKTGKKRAWSRKRENFRTFHYVLPPMNQMYSYLLKTMGQKSMQVSSFLIQECRCSSFHLQNMPMMGRMQGMPPLECNTHSQKLHCF